MVPEIRGISSVDILLYIKVEIVNHFGINPRRGGNPPNLIIIIMVASMLCVMMLLNFLCDWVWNKILYFNLAISLKLIVTYTIK